MQVYGNRHVVRSHLCGQMCRNFSNEALFTEWLPHVVVITRNLFVPDCHLSALKQSSASSIQFPFHQEFRVGPYFHHRPTIKFGWVSSETHGMQKIRAPSTSGYTIFTIQAHSIVAMPHRVNHILHSSNDTRDGTLVYEVAAHSQFHMSVTLIRCRFE